MSVKLISINVGKPITRDFAGMQVMTGIYKQLVKEPLYLSQCNLHGDEQADLVNHGGPDKAVCVYCAEHYPFWERELGIRLEPGAFGENFTIMGLLEKDVCIGDIYRVGDAVVQVTQPRGPCYKVGGKLGVTDLPDRMITTGYTGYYLRVLEEGQVAPNAPFEPMVRHSAGVTVDYVNRIKYHDKHNMDALRQILAVAELSDSWRESFLKRLETKGTE